MISPRSFCVLSLSSCSAFIDVSAKSGQLDEDELVERGHKYVKNLSEIPSAAYLGPHGSGRYRLRLCRHRALAKCTTAPWICRHRAPRW